MCIGGFAIALKVVERGYILLRRADICYIRRKTVQNIVQGDKNTSFLLTSAAGCATMDIYPQGVYEERDYGEKTALRLL